MADLTERRLVGSAWHFGEQGKAPWSTTFRFLPGGGISGYDNPHERRWEIKGEQLLILADDGKVSWKFYSSAEDGRMMLLGAYRYDRSFTGIGLLAEQPAVPTHSVVPARGRASHGKIGILVLGANAPAIIDRVAAQFDDGRFRIFLHLDAKKDLEAYKAAMREPEKITFIEERITVFWGGFSMVEAELALTRAALKDPEIANLILLSDDAAPLQSAAAIYESLMAAPDRIRSIANGWREGWYRSFFYLDSKFSCLRPDGTFEDRQIDAATGAMLTRLEKLRERGKKQIPEIHFCRQWWALSREKIERILRLVDEDHHFVESFRFSLFPDETFFPTAFRTCFPTAEVLEVPTYAEFQDFRLPNPWIYTSIREIENIKLDRDYLFMRKVAPNQPNLVTKLSEMVAAKARITEAPKETREPVRLVIWDLDETFWRGTLTEGGITYSQDYHDIVIELARRGIMSSICSKNDFEQIKALLIEKDIWKYFVFPSINWESKGPRLAKLIEAVQLRPATVLFIDDNAMNRNEALHFVPGLQVADETVIPGLLADSLYKGKSDPGLTRLAQYKLLETRQRDQATTGDNGAFLRESEIRVTIDHDIESNLDRAVELINRTNQLNYTKHRLPEEPQQAREKLRQLLNLFDVQAGLVHVQDRYGDYGLVGLYVMRTFQSQTRLEHFCFSCRTLGMGVENWLYQRLGCPDLHVVGEVLTELSADTKTDWINTSASADDAASEQLAGRILVRGGCALSSTAHYLALNAKEVVGEFNLVHDGKRVRLDHSIFLEYAFKGVPEGAMNAAKRFGYVESDFESELAKDPGGFDVCVLGFTNDARYALYKHAETGLRVPFFEHYPDPACDLTRFNIDNLPDFLKDKDITEAVHRLRAEGYLYEAPDKARFADTLGRILSLIPSHVVLFFLMDPETYSDASGAEVPLARFKACNDVIRELTAGRANTHLMQVLDFVEQPSERLETDHFNRMVYFRVYEHIARTLRSLERTGVTSHSKLEQPTSSSGKLLEHDGPDNSAVEPEAVRLVIWDLDETFWRGTLTEGGITYVQDAHDVVVELAQRGIMSSICSKNDLEPVQRLLTERGIWRYFVFPSVNWEAKGARVAAIVEAAQLRPATVLFIDDNAMNRNEALHYVPGLQVADETVIPGLLRDKLLQGKSDTELTRLKQYKLLEAKQEEKATAGDNAAFLRESRIEVTIDHDVESKIERAVELINRTNQLNFTKSRLPEAPEEAARELRELLRRFDMQAGLVHVKDRYGDYGEVGLYVMRTYESRKSLVHFCFSCRTLGMGVERYLYERLGRPALKVVGEVLTDLFDPGAEVDWIHTAGAGDGEKAERLAGRILIRGGCAMSSTAHYLALNADEVVGEFNIVRDGNRLRLDHSAFLNRAFEGLDEAEQAAAIRLGYAAEDFRSALADTPDGFDACVLSFTNDANYARYRHPETGLTLPFFEFNGMPWLNAMTLDLPNYTAAQTVLREEGWEHEPPALHHFMETLSLLLSRVPDSTVMIFLLDPEKFVGDDGQAHPIERYKALNRVIRVMTAGRANVYLLEMLDYVERPEEQAGDHFDRMVYFRIYQAIAGILRSHAAKGSVAGKPGGLQADKAA